MEKIGASLPQQIDLMPNSPRSEGLSSKCPLDYAGQRARLLFGCYRRDEAADPDTFMAAAALVLVHYSSEVVRAVTDPYSGIASRKTERGYSGLPDIAEIKDACEAEAARAARLVNAKPTQIDRRRYALPAKGEATIFTAQGYPGYDALVKRHEAEPGICRYDNHKCVDEVIRYGLWTPYGWTVPSGARAA